MSANRFAIDFDSSVTNIYKLGSGVVLSEPTVCAVEDANKNPVKAIGIDAFKLIGKTTKDTKIVFPVFEGEIVNEKVASAMLSGFLKKSGIESGLQSAMALFAVPCGVTSEMLTKFRIVAKKSGISKIYFAESPVLSAIGQHIPITETQSCFVIDMAGGTTSIATVSMEGVVEGVSVNFGGNKISTDIIDFIAQKYNLQIGLQTAERLRKEIGSLEEGDNLSTIVNGRDMLLGTPKSISLKAKDVIEPIKSYYDKIAEIALMLLRKLPPEASAEIRRAGIFISGGAAKVYGLDKYYNQKLNMQVHIADKAEYSVVLGAGAVIGDNDLLKKLPLKIR